MLPKTSGIEGAANATTVQGFATNATLEAVFIKSFCLLCIYVSIWFTGSSLAWFSKSAVFCLYE